MSKTNKVEIKLFEKVDFDKLQLLISSNDLDEDTRNKLKSYYLKKNGNSIPVNYCFSKKINEQGRLWAQHNLSLQMIRCDIRHTLAKDIYYDVDMINSGPRLLMGYCKKHNIECPKLEYYINNREVILKKISKIHNLERDDAKHLMTKLLNLGSYVIKEPSEKKLKFLNEFSEEMNKIAKEVCKIEKDLFEKVLKNKDKPHKKSTVLSTTIYNLENKCLMAMYDFFKEQNIIVGVLCFDGLMIEKNKKFDDKLPELLKSCEKYVFEKIKYNIKLAIKPMDKELPFELPEFSNFVESDKEAQERLFKLEGNNKFKFCNNELYIFNEKTGMYESNIETLYYYLMKHSDNLNTYTSKDKIESYGTSANLMKRIIPFVRTAAKDNDWLDKTSQSSLGYLLFNDGIYNMRKCKFTKGFNPKIVFHSRIPWDFPERNEEEIENAFNISFGRLFENPAPIMAALARALAGDVEIKKFYLCPGRTNAGKSILTRMLTNAFGGYIGHFNAESFAFTSSKDTKDEAAQMRWALLVRFSRILLSNEINMKKSLSGNCIKKHSSGGDIITARTHGKEEFHFHPHYTIFCMMNDIPRIEPMDNAVVERAEYIEFPYQFVNKSEKGKKPYYKIKDLELDKKIKDPAFIRGFIYILLDAYQQFIEEGMPEFDQDVKNNWTIENQQGNEIIDKIKEYFDITLNYGKTKKGGDWVSITDLKKFREQHKVFKTISGPRFNEILSDTLELKLDRDDNNRFWRGIKKRDLVEI